MGKAWLENKIMQCPTKIDLSEPDFKIISRTSQGLL